jgi:hypothetical protein
MTHAPAEFPPDPEGAFYWIGWPDEPTVYGPVWLVISTTFFNIGNSLVGTFSAQLLWLRILADLAHLANAWLVWSIAGLFFAARPGTRPPVLHLTDTRRVHLPGTRLRPPSVTPVATHRNAFALRAAALLFYIWNPLLMIEFAGSGHNDVVMLTFVLLAIWLHLKGRWPLAASALALAVLVKLPALLLLPGYVWYLFWRDYNAAPTRPLLHRGAAALARPLQALGIALLTGVVLYLPFWEGWRTLLPPLTGPANRLFVHTLAYDIWWNGPPVLANVLGVTSGRADFMQGVRDFFDTNLHLVFNIVLGITAIALTWGARTFRRLLVLWGWLMLAAAMLQAWYWPWYASWSIAVAAIAPSRRLRVTTMVLAISSLLVYVEEQVLAQHFRVFLDWSGVFIMLPPLLYIVFSWLASRRRARSVTRLPTSVPRRSRAESMPGA